MDRIGNATEELRDQFLMIAPDNNSEGSVGVIADGSSTSEVSRSTDQLARIVVSTSCMRQLRVIVACNYYNNPFSY